MAIITPFDPWTNTLCSCPLKYSLSPYTGCDHGCLYCYASSYITNFPHLRPKKDFLKKLEKEIQKIPAQSIITIANSSDPYNPLEEKLELTRKSLIILKKYPVQIILVTKSSLIERDIDILKDFPHIVACITLTTLKPSLSKRIEPQAPSPLKRLRAMHKLSREIPVACRFDPLIPGLTTEEITEIVAKIKETGARQVITSIYKTRPDNFKRMGKAFPRYKKLWDELYLEKGEKRNHYTYLPKVLREELILKVKTEAEKNGLLFSSCREGFNSYNTAACDGSHFLQNDADNHRLETADDH